jgi:hypothetical protein
LNSIICVIKGFIARPTKNPDDTLNLKDWECAIPGKQGVIQRLFKLNLTLNKTYLKELFLKTFLKTFFFNCNE